MPFKPFRALSSLFDNDELAIMHSVHDKICAELDITASAEDASRRELVSKAIVEFAEQGERDPSVLRARTVARINGKQ